MFDRRGFMVVMGGTMIAGTTACMDATPPKKLAFGGDTFTDTIRRIEAEIAGRIGIAVRDMETERAFAHRGDERFPMCSTFKFMLAAATLALVDKQLEQLDRRIVYDATVLLPNSPVTEKHVSDGMTVGALCEATITQSDNAAANLLLPGIGGPAGFTSYARTLGDSQTRLDHNEPALSEATPGDPRDTTTPSATLGNLHALLLGNVLSPASRTLLTGWLVANTTGDERLRAGLPSDWRVGDKTGSGMHGTTNDIAILWPPSRKPILVTAYITQTEALPEQRNAALAAVGRAVAAAIA